MYLCTCVSEEGEDGEGAGSEAICLLSCTLRYVRFVDLYPVWVWVEIIDKVGISPSRWGMVSRCVGWCPDWGQ
jgi:hypothetical protein